MHENLHAEFHRTGTLFSLFLHRSLYSRIVRLAIHSMYQFQQVVRRVDPSFSASESSPFILSQRRRSTGTLQSLLSFAFACLPLGMPSFRGKVKGGVT